MSNAHLHELLVTQYKKHELFLFNGKVF